MCFPGLRAPTFLFAVTQNRNTINITFVCTKINNQNIITPEEISVISLSRSERTYLVFMDPGQQLEGRTIRVIPMGTNCAPPISDLFLFCYERDFMSNHHKSKQYDLKDMFNDTSIS